MFNNEKQEPIISLEKIVRTYNNSIHPDSITTQDIIEAFNNPKLMENFISFEDYDKDKYACSKSGNPFVIGGKVRMRFEYKTKEQKIETKEKDIIVVAQTGGYLSPESLIFSREMYKKAEKKGLDLLLLVNTEGGDVMEHAALMGQSWQVSENNMTLLKLKTNTASLIVSKGASGGALCNQIANYQPDEKRPGTSLILENAAYYVISPPHCKSILWTKDDTKTVDDAVKLLLPTPECLKLENIIDTIIKEYPGGSHKEKKISYEQTLANINDALKKVFWDFETHKRDLEKIAKKRLERARDGYTPLTKTTKFSLAVKNFVPGIKSLKKIKAEKTLNDYAKEIGTGSPVYEQGFSQVSLILEREGTDDKTPMMHCGDHSFKKQPGKIVEIDEEALEFVKRKFETGKINFEKYMQQQAEVLLENHTLKNCTAVFSKNVFDANYGSCPVCGEGIIPTAMDWVWSFIDAGKDFQELNIDLDINSFKKTIYHSDNYLKEIEQAQEKTGNKSALITGVGSVGGNPTGFCALDFYFMGGSFGGMVEPRKFRDAAIYAKDKKMPVIFISSSGGARMQEGTLALKGMESTNATVQYLRDNRIPYLVVLTNPTFGGTPASLGAQGRVTFAEKGLRYGFTGPIVIQRALQEAAKESNIKIDLDEKMKQLEFMMRADVLKHVEVAPNKPLIDFVGRRNKLKPELEKYISIYYGK